MLRIGRPSLFADLGVLLPKYYKRPLLQRPTEIPSLEAFWRKRVGVEPKQDFTKSQRTMTLLLPPRSNWSQLESLRRVCWRDGPSPTEARSERNARNVRRAEGNVALDDGSSSGNLLGQKQH